MTNPSNRKSKLPIIIASALALLLVGGAVLILVFGSAKNLPAEAEATSTVPKNGPTAVTTGGVIFGPGMLPLDANSLQASSNSTTEIVVYVDYRCPHCMVFEQTNSRLLEEAVASGSATVEVRPLTFMDRYSAGTDYSSRAANMLMCAVEYQPDSAWLLHNVLLNPSVQPSGEGPGHDDATLVEMAEAATGGADSQLTNCIKDQTHVNFVQDVNEWTFLNPAIGAVDESFRVQGTPLVLINGIVYDGAIDNEAELKSYLQGQGVTFG